MRAGDALVPMSEQRLREIFLEAGPDFSAEPTAATMGDLDPAALAQFRSRWSRKSPNLHMEAWSDEALLDNAELRAEGRLLQAALILFGTRAALGRLLPNAEIVFEYRATDAPGAAQEREEFREGFLLLHDRLCEAAAHHGSLPLAEEAHALGRVRLGPELDKLFLVGPSPGRLQIDLQELGEACLLGLGELAVQPQIW